MLTPGRFYKTKDRLFYVVSDGPMNDILIRTIYPDLTSMEMTINRGHLKGAVRLSSVGIEELMEEDRVHIGEFVREMALTGWEPSVAALLELRLVKNALNRGHFPDYLAREGETTFSQRLMAMIDSCKNEYSQT